MTAADADRYLDVTDRLSDRAEKRHCFLRSLLGQLTHYPPIPCACSAAFHRHAPATNDSDKNASRHRGEANAQQSTGL
jgi:hypothetical protein